MISEELVRILVQHPLPSNQYYREKYLKRQIYLHHTGSNKSPIGDIEYWKSTVSRIATPFIIGDRNITQLFGSKYWAYHLGIPRKVFYDRGIRAKNKFLNQTSIGIEIDSWGQLVKIGNNYYHYYGGKVPKENVYQLNQPFKEYASSSFFDRIGVTGKPCIYYERYTDGQIKNIEILLKYLSKRYLINISYKDDIFNIVKRALKGDIGLYTHCSVRPDKSDIFPYPPLIQMLKIL